MFFSYENTSCRQVAEKTKEILLLIGLWGEYLPMKEKVRVGLYRVPKPALAPVLPFAPLFSPNCSLLSIEIWCVMWCGGGAGVGPVLGVSRALIGAGGQAQCRGRVPSQLISAADPYKGRVPIPALVAPDVSWGRSGDLSAGFRPSGG